MEKITKENLYEKLSAYIDGKQSFLSESTAQLLRFKTVSGGKTPEEKDSFNKSMDECIKYLKELVERFDLKFVNLDDKINYIEQPVGDKVVAIPAHLDVVPAGTGWRYPAYEGIIARGKIWGRGAQDDKGPIMACIFGLSALKEIGLKFNKKIRLLLGTGEEVGDWADIRYYGEKMGDPDFGFTPDCFFPIINGEKGILNVDLCLKCKPEIKSDSTQFYELKGGERSNIVPDHAELSFLLPQGKTEEIVKEFENEIREFMGNNNDARVDLPVEIADAPDNAGTKMLKIHFRGEAAHAMAPWNGHNSISDALKFLMKSKYMGNELKIFTEFLYKSTMDFNGKGLDIYAFHDFIGPTTINLGIIRLKDDGGKATINIRPPMGLSCEEVRAKIQKVISPVKTDAGLDISMQYTGKGTEALYLDPKDYELYFDAMKTAYQKVTKQPAELKSIGGTTYAKALKNTVCFGPVIIQGEEKELAHMKDECISINEQLRNTKIYAYALGLMAGEF